MNNIKTNNAIPSFGTKLILRSRYENSPFNNLEMRNIEDSFKKQTKNNIGELLVVYDKNIAHEDSYTFYYENKDHRDKFSITVPPEFSKKAVFVDKLKDILNLFQKREENINKIKNDIDDFETDTVISLKEKTSAFHVSQYNKW